MKKCIIFLYLSILLVSCNKVSCNKDTFQDKIGTSVKEIIYKGGDVEYNFTKNQYYLNDNFIKTGYYDLNLTSGELNIVKEKIRCLEIFKLKDNLIFVKECKAGGCLSEIIIIYDNNKKQHFIFENYLYKDNFYNKDYDKISKLDEQISKIILSKKINLETKYDKID